MYSLAAGTWIAFSDGLLASFGLTADTISRLSMYKGFGFVAVTSIVLYAAVTRGMQRLEVLSDRLSTFIDVVPIPIISLDMDFRVVLWNPAAERVFGWSAQEVLGEPLPLVPEDEWDTFVASQATLLQVPNPAGLEVVRKRKDGAPVHLRVFNAAVHDAQGRMIGSIGVLEDVTEMNAASAEIERYRDHLEEIVRQRTGELEDANESLLKAQAAKDTFLTSMSHELRTPLNSIIGFTQILLQGLAGPLNDEQARQLEMVNSSGRHLLALINDVLDLSKIGAGHVVLQRDEVLLAEVLADIEGTARPLLDEKSLDWVCECDSQEVMFTDRRRLEQILLNLVSNAVKFTERGTIRLSAKVSGSFVRFEVADTGIGISQDALELVFGEFVQIDMKEAIRPEGTGLGLAISRRLANLLGGTLVAASEVGVGSTFMLNLPVGVYLEDGAHEGVPYERERCVVLVVDDDPQARTIITKVLEGAGYAVRQASDGASALEKVAENRPDIILLDLVMPRLDGWAVLERLKSDEMTATIPIVCVSIMLESEQPSTAGFSGYLAKPIDPAGMLEMLDTVLAGTACTTIAE